VESRHPLVPYKVRRGLALPLQEVRTLKEATADSKFWHKTQPGYFFLQDLERNQANKREKAREKKRAKPCYFPRQNIKRLS
jgi:hypothetical protein